MQPDRQTARASHDIGKRTDLPAWILEESRDWEELSDYRSVHTVCGVWHDSTNSRSVFQHRSHTACVFKLILSGQIVYRESFLNQPSLTIPGIHNGEVGYSLEGAVGSH